MCYRRPVPRQGRAQEADQERSGDRGDDQSHQQAGDPAMPTTPGAVV
jgi:hypothetical protein